jgi:hypothetical protein
MALLSDPHQLYEEAKDTSPQGDQQGDLHPALREHLSASEVQAAAEAAFEAVEDEDRAETLAWLEGQLEDAWGRLSEQTSGSMQHEEGGLLAETASGADLAGLLEGSLVGARSSRTAMVPPAGLEPATKRLEVSRSVH